METFWRIDRKDRLFPQSPALLPIHCGNFLLPLSSLVCEPLLSRSLGLCLRLLRLRSEKRPTFARTVEAAVLAALRAGVFFIKVFFRARPTQITGAGLRRALAGIAPAPRTRRPHGVIVKTTHLNLLFGEGVWIGASRSAPLPGCQMY